ncbi:MAG: hypothetical protein ABW123_27445, partial [Cystobacter sp.]
NLQSAAVPAPSPTPSLTESLQAAASAAEPASGAQIETTEFELETFRSVQKICAESALKQTIAYKDSASYFAINLGKVTSWFLRVYSNGKKKSLVTRVPIEQAQLLAKGFEVEATAESMGKSRVYFTATSDIDKLRAFVLVAYEEEVKRQSVPIIEGVELPAEAVAR